MPLVHCRGNSDLLTAGSRSIAASPKGTNLITWRGIPRETSEIRLAVSLTSPLPYR
ncbi:MAG: hypothetical protein JW931_06005 [Methanomicrobiaceae archaeon]|nr:hypothetical protein [Methanomicrobiaceae archaeon]